jgi:hypothetical protein
VSQAVLHGPPMHLTASFIESHAFTNESLINCDERGKRERERERERDGIVFHYIPVICQYIPINLLLKNFVQVESLSLPTLQPDNVTVIILHVFYHSGIPTMRSLQTPCTQYLRDTERGGREEEVGGGRDGRRKGARVLCERERERARACVRVCARNETDQEYASMRVWIAVALPWTNNIIGAFVYSDKSMGYCFPSRARARSLPRSNPYINAYIHTHMPHMTALTRRAPSKYGASLEKPNCF